METPEVVRKIHLRGSTLYVTRIPPENDKHAGFERIVSVAYLEKYRMFLVVLDNGLRVSVPNLKSQKSLNKAVYSKGAVWDIDDGHQKEVEHEEWHTYVKQYLNFV